MMMDLLQTSSEMWVWADKHPYLFTMIKLGTPSVWAIIIYCGGKIMANFLNGGRRR